MCSRVSRLVVPSAPKTFHISLPKKQPDTLSALLIASAAARAATDTQRLIHPMPTNTEKRPHKRIGRQHVVTPQIAREMATAADLGVTQTQIAEKFGVHQATVSKAILRLQSTTTAASEYVASKALTLAERLIRDADVDQCLEVFDRLQLSGLTKRDQKASSTNVVVAFGGAALYGLPQPGK